MVGWLHGGNMLTRGEPPMCNALGCGHWSVISGYAGKNSNDPLSGSCKIHASYLGPEYEIAAADGEWVATAIHT